MRCRTLLLLLSVAACTAGEQRVAAGGPADGVTSQPAATPALAFDARQGAVPQTIEYTFDHVWAGDVVTHTFEVTNTSDRIMAIRSVNTTCGCTTTGKYEDEVQPGRVWKLEATLATKGRQGKLTKIVTVMTDDPDRRQIQLLFKGEVRPRFEMSPSPTVDLGALQPASAVERALTIANKYTEPVVFTRVSKTPKGLKATLREIVKGQRYQLDIETVPPLAEVASFEPIVLDTDLKDEPTVSVFVYGYVQPRVALAPKVLMVASPIDREIRRELRVQMADGTKASVTGVETSSPAITASLDPAPAGQPQRIRVNIAQGTDIPPGGETLTVYTDDPEFASLVCQIRAFRIGRAAASQPAATRSAGAASKDG